MAITIEATYENGVLKLAHPLPLQEHQKVQVAVHTEKTRAEQTAGLMGWTGPAELADYFAMDPDYFRLAIQDCPTTQAASPRGSKVDPIPASR
jgi:predicted DNA-binding antitoxin AbrB/MazE fold protein